MFVSYLRKLPNMQINTPLYLCLIKTWRAVLALATHHPPISIKLNISMTSSESYWNKKGKTFELWVDEITESTQQRAIMMGLSSRARLTFEGAILFEENQQEIPFRGNGAVYRKKQSYWWGEQYTLLHTTVEFLHSPQWWATNESPCLPLKNIVVC